MSAMSKLQYPVSYMYNRAHTVCFTVTVRVGDWSHLVGKQMGSDALQTVHVCVSTQQAL